MTQPEVVFSIFEPEPEGMGMGLKLIDPQKWFVLDDFMVSDPNMTSSGWGKPYKTIFSSFLEGMNIHRSS
jgi:hypothetical protein